MQLQEAITGKQVEVSPKTFGQEFNEALVHQVVTAYLTSARSGTKAQLARSEVRGGGAKPWRQKGTGRARAGTPTSPIWRAGGVTFAAKPRDFTQKVNRKMYRGAMRAILSELARQQRLQVADSIAPSAPRTKELVQKLASIKAEKNVLIIVKEWDTNLYLAARNLPRVDVTEVSKLDPVALVRSERVLITSDAVKALEEVYGNE